MNSIYELCQPRQEILAGSFNPEIFTASLSPIIEHYRGKNTYLDEIYTDANKFFLESTYPTQGLTTILYEVFSRLSGDFAVPAIHRLETAFGGGKTHALIACAHIAKQGKSISESIKGFLPIELHPEPGSIILVGVAGEEIPVHQTKGKELVPYTLWGEIAYQVGGEALYHSVENEAGSYAAPGRNFFEKVFGDQKVLIMLDELAQYAARLEAARPDGASQLAAFLMGLHGYARSHPGIAIVLTLASSTDAFSKQTGRLAELISQVRGEETSEIDALGIGERAVKGVASVVARDAVQITPVQAGELSSVLAKRLFVTIDLDGAQQTVVEYVKMYMRNSSALPEEATRETFKNRMKANYPFHPTLIDYLNIKLADAENFQGTRGVLRVLALAVRRLWETKHPALMIHTCHLDLRSERVVNEILGRTGSSDLLFVLNADVGGVDTGSIEGGSSNAELAELENPHPQGFPYYEYTWKTIFLHSLVGREDGLESKIMGITEPEVFFAVSFPGLTPPQVHVALDEVSKRAFYLRFEQGKYFASKHPTINSVLARIRKTIKAKQVADVLSDTSKKIVTNGPGPFSIEHDVLVPEDLPDGKGQPILGIVSINGDTIDIEALITTKGPNMPREQQNLIYLLAPVTVSRKVDTQPALFLDQEKSANEQESKQRLAYLARQVKAIRMLVENPQNYGVNPGRLEEDDCKKNFSQFENDLITAVAGSYNILYYPSTSGEIVQREVKTGGGEGGAPFIQIIRQVLLKDGKLITSDHTTQADLISLSKLFFSQGDTASLKQLRQQFSCTRRWPLLEGPAVFDQIIRAGVQKDVWSVYRMDSDEDIKPTVLYYRDNDVPLGVDLSMKGYGVVTPQGAKQRDWIEGKITDPVKTQENIIYVLSENGQATVKKVFETVTEKYGAISEIELREAVATLVKEGCLFAFHEPQKTDEKPDLIHGTAAILYSPQFNDVLITPALAAERGWVSPERQSLNLAGREGAKIIIPLLRKLGSIYNRGAKSTVESLDLVDLKVQGGGLLRLQLTKVSPEGMIVLGEFFEILDGIVLEDDSNEAFLQVSDPDDDCLLIRELRELIGEDVKEK